MRPLLRHVMTAALTGALTVGAAWAGTGLVPVSPAGDATRAVDGAAAQLVDTGSPPAVGEEVTVALAEETSDGATLPSQALSDGWYWAGAAKVNLHPDPDSVRDEYPDAQWVTGDACHTMDEDVLSADHTHVVAAGSPWPENPNCIYVGGYGIGPMNPVDAFDDEYGLWVRTFALSDGEDPLFVTVIDAEGWFWDYAERTQFGWKVIAEQLAAELGVDRSAFIFHATHSHTAMDFIGGWGYVPEWYMEQARRAVVESVRGAVASMVPARLEVGEELARSLNHERRDTYHAPEEPGLVWLRAYVPGGETTETTYEHGKSENHTTTTTTEEPDETIATIGTFAAHPTTVDVDQGIAHADWPGVFAARVEERFGGIGLHFMSGLGNMSAAGGTMMGQRLADRIPEIGGGEPFTETSVATAQATWAQPVTNAPLSALGVPGFFDRKFLSQPATLRTGDNPDEAPCVSASPVAVEVAASAARVGSLLFVTAGPGEMFSNSTNTIKEKAAEDFGTFHYAMPIAQANDALGYLPESFEAAQNPASGEGAGFAASGPLYIEYEDAYAIDRCFGDMNLETTLGLMYGLR